MKIGSSGNTQDLVTGVGLGSSAGGDVGGTLPGGTIVEGIQGVPVDVDAATPANRDALIYEAGTGWIADHVQAEDVVYDPTASGSPETDVQGELDRLEALVAGGVSMVPYYIGPTETFTVPLYRQALFATTIDVEGILDVAGLLIEVS